MGSSIGDKKDTAKLLASPQDDSQAFIGAGPIQDAAVVDAAKGQPTSAPAAPQQRISFKQAIAIGNAAATLAGGNEAFTQASQAVASGIDAARQRRKRKSRSKENIRAVSDLQAVDSIDSGFDGSSIA